MGGIVGTLTNCLNTIPSKTDRIIPWSLSLALRVVTYIGQCKFLNMSTTWNLSSTTRLSGTCHNGSTSGYPTPKRELTTSSTFLILSKVIPSTTMGCSHACTVRRRQIKKIWGGIGMATMLSTSNQSISEPQLPSMGTR